jgi:formate hydrogenlyase subunit 6/NADH:ubiquinone oxidoreductase subunit I
MSMLTSILKSLFSRPDTVKYPKGESPVPPGNRGKVVWDMQKCIYCRLCEKNCPTKAITTDKAGKTQSIKRLRCIQCRTCVDVCPTNTISMLTEYAKPVAHKEVHVYGADMKPFEYRVERLDEKKEEKKNPPAPEVKEEKKGA